MQGNMHSTTILDITNQFTYNLPDGTPSFTALYFPESKVVIASLSVAGASAFDTNTDIFKIPSAYTPATSGHTVIESTTAWSGGGIVKNASGTYPARLQAGSYGGIRQIISSVATDVSGTVMWKVQ